MSGTSRRDRLGAQRLFFDPVSGRHDRTLRGLLEQVPSAREGGLDAIGIEAAWGNADAPERTCLLALRAVPPGASLGGARVGDASMTPHEGSESGPRDPDLASCLVSSMRRAAGAARRPVVALGGGIDAPLAVLAARRAGIEIVEAIHLSMPGTTYDEAEAARETAAALGLALHELHVTGDDLARELSHAVRIAETPLYNLHPVSRAIVARVAAARGHDVLLTGDGADQAARGATERADYVPVVAALTYGRGHGSGLALASPFLDEAVVDRLVAARDPGKNGLRALAVDWGLPSAIAERPKVPCSAPPLARSAFPAGAMLARLSLALGRPLAWTEDDRANVGIATLAAFVASFEISALRRVA